MPPQPTIDDLARAVVVVRDPYGREARYVIDHIAGEQVHASYMFRGRHMTPLKLDVDDVAELGTGGVNGWVHAVGVVVQHSGKGELVVRIDDLRLVQRRTAYREEVVLPLKASDDPEAPPRKGRTQNLSTGGFAGRFVGTPFDDGEEVVVTFDFPQQSDVTIVSRKIGGDLPQRFQFVSLDRRTEEMIAKTVREAELERRRSRRQPE